MRSAAPPVPLLARICTLALILAAHSTVTHALEIQHSESRYADKKYQYDLIVTLDVPIEKVEALLRDYEHYPSLDPRILQARVLDRPAPNVATLETVLRACFGPICRNVDRIERVEESPHALAAITDPSRSDVKFGETHTQLSVEPNDRTRVSYRTSVTPGFWIPSIVGRRWMLRTLEDATCDLFTNLEMRAKNEAGAANE